MIAVHPQTARTVFLVAGGGSMHLVDAIGRNRHLMYVCNHHEQACAMAAEGYARVSNKIGVACVTSGPGGTNAITGVLGAWLDSIPILVISGQVKFETTIASEPRLRLRQMGDQEINIVDVVRPITKYAAMVTDKHGIRYHLEKALFEAKNGRPGPVWIDVPLDVQGSDVDHRSLAAFKVPDEPRDDFRLQDVMRALRGARRPVIIAGNGIALAGARAAFRALIKKLNIPVLGTFARYDILTEDHPLFFGRFGSVGQRAANFIVQNSDLILAIGARLNIRAVSYRWSQFAREATKIVVDTDPCELRKHTLQVDIPVRADAGRFIQALGGAVARPFDFKPWLGACRAYRKKYPTILPVRQSRRGAVDSYNFFHVLSEAAASDSVFVFGNGTACVSSYQTLKLKGRQRVIVNSGCASMGYDLPAAIGAFYGSRQTRPVVCVTGDGSLQMNLQELQTVVHYRIPLKLFILNNGGYISIRNTQRAYMNGRLVGSNADSGLSCPDTLKIARAYGLPACRISGQQKLKHKLCQVLSVKGPMVCEIMLDAAEEMSPRLASVVAKNGKMISRPLEDMYPFLERDELKANMLIPLSDE